MSEDRKKGMKLPNVPVIPDEWPQPLTARALSWLAEQAEGMRNQDLSLVENLSGNIQLKLAEDVTSTERPLIGVRTEDKVPGRYKMEKITVKAPNCPTADVPEGWDALFWTEASIEKFFFPYYYSQRLLTEEDITALWADFKDKTVVAFAHILPSRPVPIRGIDAAGVVFVDEASHALPTLELKPLSEYLAQRQKTMPGSPA